MYGPSTETKFAVSSDVMTPVRRFERVAPDGEIFTPHCFRDGLYRVANPALGRTKHHAENQLPVRFDDIHDYLQRGYFLRMRGNVSKQINLISLSDISVFF